jgi:hypothetical protein
MLFDRCCGKMRLPNVSPILSYLNVPLVLVGIPLCGVAAAKWLPLFSDFVWRVGKACVVQKRGGGGDCSNYFC